jgi:predicted  nucleic acid-binding Zn-ribbon protein
MSLLERLGELGKALMTTDTELRHLRETMGEIRQEVRGLRDDVQDLRERIIRLETARGADRSQLEAELARFKVEVERAELRLARQTPPHNEPPALPDKTP